MLTRRAVFRLFAAFGLGALCSSPAAAVEMVMEEDRRGLTTPWPRRVNASVHSRGPRSRCSSSLFEPIGIPWTFSEFVVTDRNRNAHAAAQAVAEAPGRLYNPLWLYGPQSAGKTHLLQAIGHRIGQADPSRRILYQSGGNGHYFLDTERLREWDVLLVDNIDLISQRDSYLEVYRPLWESGTQIVFASNRDPKDLPHLEKWVRWASPVRPWGLICRLEPVDLDTRVAYVRYLAGRDGVVLPEERVMRLARATKNLGMLDEGVYIARTNIQDFDSGLRFWLRTKDWLDIEEEERQRSFPDLCPRRMPC